MTSTELKHQARLQVNIPVAGYRQSGEMGFFRNFTFFALIKMENADLHWHSSIEKLQNTDNCVRT